MQNVSTDLQILLHIIGLVLFTGLHASIALKAKKTALLRPYILIVAGITIWLSTVPVMQLSENRIWLFLIFAVKYAAISLICVSVSLLGLTYWLGRSSQLQRTILFAPVLLLFALIASNPLHGLFGDMFASDQFAPGLLFYTAGLIYLLLVLSGLVFFLLGVRKQSHDRDILRILFVTGIALPVITWIYRVLSPENFTFDWTPLATVFSSMMFAAAAASYRFLDLLPISRRDIIHEMDSALVVAREDGMVIDCNAAFAQIHGVDKRSLIGRFFSELLYLPVEVEEEQTALIALHKRLMTSTKPVTVELKIQTETGQHDLEVMLLPLFASNQRLIGRLYRLTDLTRERQLRQLLSDQNKQLEIANRSIEKRSKLTAEIKRMSIRNQLARELHDQLGHTIIMTISALEKIERISDEKDRWQEIEMLREHLSQQLQRSVPVDSKEDTRKTDSIRLIFESLQAESKKAGISLAVDVKGDATRIPAGHIHDLQQICREAMTNSIKHGRAGQISIFLKILENEYDLAILDDGNGAESFSPGFGINSMRTRIKELRGSIRFQSDSAGFGIFIHVPISARLRPDS